MKKVQLAKLHALQLAMQGSPTVDAAKIVERAEVFEAYLTGKEKKKE
jgi:hypothetical protein